MSTRKIIRTFTFQESIETPAILYPRSDGRWGGFQNTYAVWPTNGNEVNSYVIKRIFEAPYSGTYYFRSTVDNSGTIYVDNNVVGGTANFNQTPSPVAVTLSQGSHMLRFNVANGGDVAGFALAISNASDAVIWDTRTYATVTSPPYGRYNVVLPFRANITAHLWGAGGGGGGMDAGSQGGLGSPGLYNTHTFVANKGDILEVTVGNPGTGGASNTGGAPGGPGGASRVNINGDPVKSFNGGNGTAAGPVPYSGGGGGGGGATAVLVNNVAVAVAGGGGGGGGAGNDGNGPYARRDAVITNNATGASGSDYRGENGQTKGGDGGGAGGGGGGFPGGQGGAVAGGDSSGFCGQCGGNLPANTATTGIGTFYYQTGYAAGGQRGGGYGQAGRAVLEIVPIGLASIKVDNDWKQVPESFVKVAGTWREVSDIFIKVDDTWRKVENAGLADVDLVGNASNYGSVVRSYS
jgi:hypothetical protein